MSVRELGSEVASHVWARLKPLGFRRQAALFLREGPDFGERYALVGSRWNSGAEPWEFSVSVGIFFADVPALKNAKGFWRHAHAVGPSARVVPGSEPSFRVSRESVEQVASQVVAVILLASEALPSLAPRAHPRAQRGLISPLPVPQDGWD